MNQQIITQFIEIIFLALVGIGLLLIVASSIYDILATRRRHILESSVRRLRRPRQPHVTVLVYSKNNAESVEACLKSVIRSRYYEYDVVVVDNVSSDNTKRVVREFISNHQSAAIYLYAKIKSASQLKSLRQGYSRSQKGDIILAISADSVVSEVLIKTSVAYLAMNPKVKTLSISEQTPGLNSMAAIISHFMRLTRNIYAKGMSQLAIGRMNAGTLNVVYSREFFVASNHKLKTKYAVHGSLTRASGGRDIGLTGYVLATVTIIAMTYFMYIAATLQSSELLVASWLILAVWLLLVIWLNDDSTIWQKLQLSFLIPSFYFLIYVWQIITLAMNSGRALSHIR